MPHNYRTELRERLHARVADGERAARALRWMNAADVLFGTHPDGDLRPTVPTDRPGDVRNHD